MPPSETLSLRERKKLETWDLIHDAAAGLALDEDIPCVTVEAIASEAGVSQRTFFNYFPTKEDAILGVRTPQRPELPEGFLDGQDLLRRTTEMLLEVSRSAYSERGADRRAGLYAKFPNLLLRRRELSLQCEDLLQQALADAMARALEELMRGRTTIAVAHRRSPTRWRSTRNGPRVCTGTESRTPPGC